MEVSKNCNLSPNNYKQYIARNLHIYNKKGKEKEAKPPRVDDKNTPMNLTLHTKLVQPSSHSILFFPFSVSAGSLLGSPPLALPLSVLVGTSLGSLVSLLAIS